MSIGLNSLHQIFSFNFICIYILSFFSMINNDIDLTQLYIDSQYFYI